jgi:hypothetical protein
VTFEEARRILELGSAPTLAEAKGAYRRLVKLWHPDLEHEDPEARLRREARTKEINAAYRRLTSTLLSPGRVVRPEPGRSGVSGVESGNALERWAPWFRDFQWETWNLRDGVHEIAFLVLGVLLFLPFWAQHAQDVEDWTQELVSLFLMIVRVLLQVVTVIALSFGYALLRVQLRAWRHRWRARHM